MNQSFLSGHVGKDSEISVTKNGKSVLKFSMATSGFKGKDGVAPTHWHNIVYWTDRASQLAPLIKKGSFVFVAGSYESRQYTAKDGTKKYFYEVIAKEVVTENEKTQPEEMAPQTGFNEADIPF